MSEAIQTCEDCGEEYIGDSCQDCCDHDYDADEGFHCLNCGKDGSEAVQGRAYDAYKDRMKYGDM